jgi:hypothetical protein
VQVYECGAATAMTHAVHEFPECGTSSGGQVIAGMPEIMKVRAFETRPD